MLANHCGLEADEFVYFLGNAHIYEEHISALKEQVKREPMEFPAMKMTKTHENIEEYTLEEIEWTRPYQCHPTISMTMIS
jgi:thymidylate synthase